MNITNLIPYLLNKITKVETSVDNIDFSSAPSNPSLYDFKNKEYIYEPFLIKGTTLGASASTFSYSNFKSSISTTSGTALAMSTLPTNITNSVSYKPTLVGYASSVGSIVSSYIGINPSNSDFAITIKSHKIVFKTVISLSNYITNRSYSLGIGSITASVSGFSGYGVFFQFGFDTNGGNVRYGFINDTVITISNSNILITASEKILFEIHLDCSTNTTTYYINNNLIGTQNNSSYTSQAFKPFYHLQTLNVSQTTASRLHVHNLFIEVED